MNGFLNVKRKGDGKWYLVFYLPSHPSLSSFFQNNENTKNKERKEKEERKRKESRIF